MYPILIFAIEKERYSFCYVELAPIPPLCFHSSIQGDLKTTRPGTNDEVYDLILRGSIDDLTLGPQ